MTTETTKTAYYADCDQFDNARTGYHATADEATHAFWLQNTFTDAERARVRVYVNEVSIGADELDTARYLASTGVPSPALNIDHTA